MKERKKIELSMTTMDVLLLMGEGNPGALSVLMKLMERGESSILKILTLDDMNIRGEQIWIAFKDHCKEDLDAFMEAIARRDLAMISTVNANSSEGHIARRL